VASQEIISEITAQIQKKKVAFFVGAGISVEPPARLPLAKEAGLAAFCSLFSDKKGILPRYYKKNKSFLEDEISKIKLESLFQVIFEVIEKHTLEAMRIFEAGEPNNNHRLLGWMLREGLIDSIFTTNFDSLIEKDLIENQWRPGFDFQVQKTDSDFTSNSNPAIYKLHGSVDPLESITVIIDEVGKGLSARKREVLEKCLDTKAMVFMGYSNRDFDTSPILRTGKRKIYWIKHDQEAIEPEDWIVESHLGLGDSPDEIDQYISIHEGTKITCNTTSFVAELSDSLGFKLTPSKPENASRVDRDLASFFAQWASSIDDDNKFLIIAEVLSQIGRWKDAVRFYKRGIVIRNKTGHEDSISWIYTEIGEIYGMQGKLRQAMRFFEKGRRSYEKFGDRYHAQRTYLDLGNVYLRKGEVETALSYFSKFESILEEHDGKEFDKMSAYDRIAEAYCFMEEWEKALHYCMKVVNLSKDVGDVDGLISGYNGLGIIHSYLGDVDKATEYLNEALVLCEKRGFLSGIATVYINLGDIYYHKDDLTKALDCFMKALDWSEKLGDNYGVTTA